MASILFVLNASTGGAALSARDLVAGLKKKGHQVFLVCPPNIYHSPKQVYGDVADGVEELFLPTWDKRYRMFWAKRPLYFGYQLMKSRGHFRPVKKICQLIREWDIDLVHTNTSTTLDGALAAKICAVPHVWHIREQIGAKALFRWSVPESVLAKIFDRLSTRIVANSEFSRAFFVRNGLQQKTAVVYNGIDLTGFDSDIDRAELRQTWGVAGDTVLFGMIANVTSHFKRHDVFIRAAAAAIRQGMKAKFVIVGYDPIQEAAYRSDLAYAKELREIARIEGLEAHLIWAGYQEDVPEVCSALDVLVHPFENEGFGRIAIEAMAARIPTIVSDGGGLREIVEHGKTGLKVKAADVSEFASAMITLAEDASLRTKMGEAGRRRAEQVFSLSNMVDQLDQIYQDISALSCE
jgi:glycosyltransferase involved in cell wall biosynthesis